MAFVNVAGGDEIYNFRIHRLVHFYSRIWSFWCSNRDSANKLVTAALCAATPHPRPRPRAALLGVHTRASLEATFAEAGRRP
jgi:hypothetical protein